MRLILSAVLLLAATAASADVTARYSGPDGGTLVIEADERGRARIGVDGSDSYSLLTGDESFVVTSELGETTVLRWADLTAAAEASATGGEGPPPAEPAPGPEVRYFERGGEASVEGRSGIIYATPGEPTSEASRIVLSEDPRLAPLGRAWAQMILDVPTFARLLFGRPSESDRQLSELLAEGAPLQLGEIRLVEISFDELPESRFEFPVEPMSREQVAETMRQRLEANAAR